MKREWVGLFVCAVAAYGAFAENGAVLEPVENTWEKTEPVALVFSDRSFELLPPPDYVKGKPFLQGSIAGEWPLVVKRGGTLDVITPVAGSCSNVKELLALGFTRVEAVKPYQLFGTNPQDVCAVFEKQVKAGDSFKFKKWVVYAGFSPEGLKKFALPNVSPRVEKIIASFKGTPREKYSRDIRINSPDYVVFIPRQPQEENKRDPFRPGDTYNDHFQVIENKGKLFAFWTQATTEAYRDQHIAFSRSFDKGETWSEPVILAGSHCKAVPGLLASWQQPMISKSGRIYVLWNQQTTSAGPHCGQMFGFYSEDDGTTWSAPKMVPWTQRMDADPADITIPPSWCNWQRPLRLGLNDRFFVGVSRHGKAPYDAKNSCKVEFLQYDNIDENPPVDKIHLSFFSTNKKALTAVSPKFGSACEEAAIVKLPDGRLFAMMRSSIGHPVWSQSRDHGVTWSPAKPLLDHDGGTAYLHSRSPCPMYDWKGCEAGSGQYFALVHQTFDFNGESEYQARGPLYLIAGHFAPNAEQPIAFLPPKMFAPRKGGNSFYTSYTYFDGKGILWFNDKKFYLLGREIGPEWFKDTAADAKTAAKP